MKTIFFNLAALFATALMATMALASDLGDLPDPTNPGGGHRQRSALSPSGVQSILITPQRKQAVINGRTLSVGDRLGEAVITDILPYEVILNRAGKESRMRLIPRLDKQHKEGGAT